MKRWSFAVLTLLLTPIVVIGAVHAAYMLMTAIYPFLLGFISALSFAGVMFGLLDVLRLND